MAPATIKLSEGIFILFSRYTPEPPAIVSHAFIAVARILLYSCIDWWLSLIIRSAFYFSRLEIIFAVFLWSLYYAWSECMNKYITLCIKLQENHEFSLFSQEMTRPAPAVDWFCQALTYTNCVKLIQNKSLWFLTPSFLGLLGLGLIGDKILCVINLVWACLNNQITHKANLFY